MAVKAEKAWPADRVKRWPVSKLQPDKRNARTHSAEQVGQLVEAIKQWGWTTPILAQPDGTIIAGHGRYAAALQLGLKAVPVMVAENWSAAQTRAYILADNQLALNAGWDSELLKIELQDLDTAGFDLASLGFSDADLAKHLERDLAAAAKDTAPQLGGLTYSIVVSCSDEDNQHELLDRFEKEGLTVKALVS